MAVIELRNGLTMDTIPQAETVVLVRRDALLDRIAALRREWEAGVEGKPLAEVKASVEAMLCDFTTIVLDLAAGGAS